MSAPAFTPGPWRVLDHLTAGPTIVVSNDQKHIADADFNWWPAEQCAANARLIAAAPELYRQLEIFVSTIVNDDLLAMDPELASEVEATVALLAKARGEQ